MTQGCFIEANPQNAWNRPYSSTEAFQAPSNKLNPAKQI